jgi:hypothetical protein
MSNAAQIEAVAAQLARDRWLGVRDRIRAVAACHRARLGLPISNGDVAKLLELYARRRREAIALALAYSQGAA